MHQRHPTEISRRRPKNNNKPCIELSESIFSILGDCWEEFICFSLPARLMEEFQASKVYLQLITWLTGKFPADVSPGTFSHFGCGQRTKFRPSVGEGGGGGGIVTPSWGRGNFWQKNSCQIFYTSNPNRHPQLYFSKQHFPSLDRSLLPNSHPAKIDLKNIYFFRNRSIGCPWCMLWL